jgi:hypothetical protein
MSNEVRYLAGEKMGEATSKSLIFKELKIKSLMSSCRTYLCFSPLPLIGILVCLKKSPSAQSKNTYKLFLEIKRILKASGGLDRGAHCKKYITLLGRKTAANFLNSSHDLALKISIVYHLFYSHIICRWDLYF